MTGNDSDEERPRKRSRRNGSVDTRQNSAAPADDIEAEDDAIATSPRHGKKPGGKSAGKGTKPRTVVRGVRGLVPMEVEPDGNQHPAGELPESVKAGEGGEEGGEEDDEDDDVPLAKRPELDDKERKRRELAKEKAREKEDEVVRRLAKGTNVDQDSAMMDNEEEAEGVEVWEGVKLVSPRLNDLSPVFADRQPKLPPRPAAIEQEAQEIMLPVVSSRNPTPVATILLIGLKNLFQRQLPKMPREYITRLVLDKNHISMAIVKRGWKVVGGICYRPFESRGFAEIVFCAVDSSEQIKVSFSCSRSTISGY
jgi:histone acetyltransferase